MLLTPCGNVSKFNIGDITFLATWKKNKHIYFASCRQTVDKACWKFHLGTKTMQKIHHLMISCRYTIFFLICSIYCKELAILTKIIYLITCFHKQLRRYKDISRDTPKCKNVFFWEIVYLLPPFCRARNADQENV